MRRVVIATGKVAEVLSKFEVAINLGTADGIREEDVVLAHRVIEIRDPDSHEILGSVERPLIELEVTQVEKNFCTATSNQWAPDPDTEGALITWNISRKRMQVTDSADEAGPGRAYLPAGKSVRVVRDEPEKQD